MSRGFVKEGDQEELPMIPPRAPLPEGEVNYVTPEGFAELRAEREQLENERKSLSKENELEYRHATMVIDGKLKLLTERITSARIVKPGEQAKDEVRFGAFVEVLNGKHHLKFQIVGVDEANIKKQKIAFTAPIARAIIGKKINETVSFNRRSHVDQLKILKIRYAD